MKIALYAGSFDPITLGHLDIIKQSSQIFDKIIIGIAKNPDKKDFIPIEDRLRLINECISGIPNAEVYYYEGLTTDFAGKHNASFLIRGLRNSADFEYELQLAKINSDLAQDIKTIFLTSKSEYSHISSSVVRELISYNQDISKYVPSNVKSYFE